MLWLLLPSHLISAVVIIPDVFLSCLLFPLRIRLPAHLSVCRPHSRMLLVVLRRRLREGRLDESAHTRKGLCSFRASVASVVFRER